MRDTVDAASVVCSVVNTRCPVSAARQRNPCRFRVAHLAYHDHIRGLPHRGSQRGREVRRIHADLYLLNQAMVVRMLVFDRVFDGHNMPRIPLVDRVHHALPESWSFPSL